jgi:stage V sporulation protein T
MRATGIVRRMDDLGRVVVPKEIRKSLGIEEGDALEIFTTQTGMVCFQKYRDKSEVMRKVEELLESLPTAELENDFLNQLEKLADSYKK